ncbi:protein FAM8A1 [Sceloporus undulatus]|uniref:protein FAM8A1 n=1 Tax=Sceloporus undulatus TaxID=8520 RepID=UPI001C4D86FC|nr:protein FAM8A1 [Sceloporus undulatus]
MAEEPAEDGGGPAAGGGRDAAATASSSSAPETLSAGEYSRRVHQWLWDSYCGYLSWQSSGLAALMTSTTATAQTPGAYYYNSSGGGSSNPCYYLLLATPAPESGPAPSRAPWQPPPPAPPLARHAPPASRPGHAPSSNSSAAAAASGSAPSSARDSGRPAGREYIIPSLAHRFIAEMVDFFILFLIKATIVLSIMHLSGIKDISKFAMHYIIEEIDEDTSMEDLQKMMVVALVYRLLVCFYEIICIWGAGGATPGKFLLGLRVVTCDTSVLIAPSRVLVIPSSNVSMTTSTIRALIKNFSIASFFPAFITLLFFQHNRTAYDIVAGTIVVKRHSVR